MIYPHQQKAIDYITEKFKADSRVEALLLSGSISHGFNDEQSDVDINIVVSEEVLDELKKEHRDTYWESASDFYQDGYFDGKFISHSYLAMVAERGNEPTKFALHDAKILFDRTGKVDGLLKKIGQFDLEEKQDRTMRFLSQLEAWRWYCDEALKRENQYLLDLSVSKLILFGARLILLDNHIFFPYHKWLMIVLDKAENKPEGLMAAVNLLVANKSPENITRFYEIIKNHKDWANGKEYSWPSHFVHDIETIWMRQEEFIENI